MPDAAFDRIARHAHVEAVDEAEPDVAGQEQPSGFVDEGRIDPGGKTGVTGHGHARGLIDAQAAP